MAQRGAPDGWDSPADRPSILQITVESTPRRSPSVRRVHVLIAIAVFGAIAGAIAIAVLPSGGPGSAPPASPSPPAPTPPQPSVLVNGGPPSVAAPELYGCWYSKTTAVERNRTSPCTPPDAYVTVVVGQVEGVSRVTLEPINRSCSQMPVPPLARGKVRACRR